MRMSLTMKKFFDGTFFRKQKTFLLPCRLNGQSQPAFWEKRTHGSNPYHTAMSPC